MQNDTFRLRLSKLVQKTRKALRLYSQGGLYAGGNGRRQSPQSVISGKTAATSSGIDTPQIDYSGFQVEQWRLVTQDLLEKIAPLLEHSHTRKLVVHFYGVRDQFYTEWRLLQADLHQKQQELVESSEAGDFVGAARMSLELVQLKARMQACQAAHSELQGIIKQSKVSDSVPVSSVPGPQQESLDSGDYSQALSVGSGAVLQEPDVSEEDFSSDTTPSKVIPLRRKQVY